MFGRPELDGERGCSIVLGCRAAACQTLHVVFVVLERGRNRSSGDQTDARMMGGNLEFDAAAVNWTVAGVF
jgi:hypothetical protein